MARVLVGVPSGGDWKANFGRSLAHMFLMTKEVAKEDLLLTNQQGSALSIQRTRIVKTAQAHNATHLLFLDSDMTFPPDTLDRLIKHDLDVVAANCPVKCVPSQPTARVWENGRWELVVSGKNSAGLQKVDRIGTGVMLINMRVFDVIEQPWFAFLWEGPDGEYQGEDWCLCEQIEKAGIDIWIDHDVSKEIGHIGNFTYGHHLVKPEMLRHPGCEDFRRWEDRGIVIGRVNPGG